MDNFKKIFKLKDTAIFQRIGKKSGKYLPLNDLDLTDQYIISHFSEMVEEFDSLEELVISINYPMPDCLTVPITRGNLLELINAKTKSKQIPEEILNLWAVATLYDRSYDRYLYGLTFEGEIKRLSKEESDQYRNGHPYPI